MRAGESLHPGCRSEKRPVRRLQWTGEALCMSLTIVARCPRPAYVAKTDRPAKVKSPHLQHLPQSMGTQHNMPRHATDRISRFRP